MSKHSSEDLDFFKMRVQIANTGLEQQFHIRVPLRGIIACSATTKECLIKREISTITDENPNDFQALLLIKDKKNNKWEVLYHNEYKLENLHYDNIMIKTFTRQQTQYSSLDQRLKILKKWRTMEIAKNR